MSYLNTNALPEIISTIEARQGKTCPLIHNYQRKYTDIQLEINLKGVDNQISVVIGYTV